MAVSKDHKWRFGDRLRHFLTGEVGRVAWVDFDKYIIGMQSDSGTLLVGPYDDFDFEYKPELFEIVRVEKK